MSWRHFLFLALMIGAVAVWQWLVIAPPTPVRPATLAQETWKIPDQVESDVKEASAILNNASLWGKQADTAQLAPQADPKWTFLGAITRGAERQLILSIENQPEQRLVPGDNLPDGSQILSIEDDILCVLTDGQKRSLPIYTQGRLSNTMPVSTEEASACPETAKRSKGKRQ